MTRSFWFALLVLVVNDHLLKGSGRVPAALTGKLSDFAGLIVAPGLACVLLGASTARARAVGFALVAVPFAAVKLSPGCAEHAGALLTALGVPSRIVCDPSDLLAFAVLPWSWRLARAVRAADARAQAWRQRFGIAAAALACIATSSQGPSEVALQPPFVINWSRFDLTVRVVPEAASDPACVSPAPTGAAGSFAGAPIAQAPRTLAPGMMMELVPSAGAPAGSCGSAWIEIEDGPTVRISWSAAAGAPITRTLHGSLAFRSWRLEATDDWAFERAVAIAGAPRAFVPHAGSRLQLEVSP